MFDRARSFVKKYERYISPVTVVFGFIFDNITLRRIDVLFSNALLITYLLVSALSIMILNIHEYRRTKEEREKSEVLHAVAVFVMQFCLGGMFSASFLFYSRSGSILASWPFLLMLIGYVIGNEVLRKNYIRLGFQISVFFTALFSFMIFFLPIIFGRMGDDMFLLSGITSLIVTGVFIYILSWFAPERTRKGAPILIVSLGGLFTLMNALYFTNLIPPIPLSLKDVGIYRSVTHLSFGGYETVGEEQKWSGLFRSKPIIHVEYGASTYALTAIFAPSNLETRVVHRWERYDEVSSSWKTESKVTLDIVGGREKGYTTYSESGPMIPGSWRVNVETPRGQLVGRLSFDVALPLGNETLITEIR